jgi:competence protein ComEC
VRKLACFAIFFAAAVFCAQLLPRESAAAAAIPAIAALLLALTLLPKLRRLSRVGFYRLALLGLMTGSLYFSLWQWYMAGETERYLGEARTVEAVVLEEPERARFAARAPVKLGRLRCSLYYDSSTELHAGDRIRVAARFRDTAEKTDGDVWLSMGVQLFGSAVEPPQRLGRAENEWRYYPARLGLMMREMICSRVDADTAAFLLAILTGDRSRLREDTWFYSMLRSSGVAHCVAVSGMHLSFLMSFLYFFLGRGKPAALACIPVTLLFMAVTGFTASVVRAGIMQLAVCVAVLTKHEYDSLSALALALLVLVLANPYCVQNAGLLLSFGSTLGILLFMPELLEWLPDLPKKTGRRNPLAALVRFARSSLAVSLSASVFTVPLTALFFGQVSLLAPLTNLLVLWAVSLCFSLGLLSLPLGLIPGSGPWLQYPLRLLVGWIRLIAGTLGSFPLAAVYTRSVYIRCWLLLSGLTFLVYRAVPALRPCIGSYILTVLAALALFWGFSVLEPRQDDLWICALDVGQGQCIAVTNGDSAVLLDCGGSLSANAGDIAAEYLFSLGKMQADALVLTHFHADHMNGAEELLRRLRVKALYVPRPDPEDAGARRLIAFALEQGCGVRYVEELLEVSAGSQRLTLIPPLDDGSENESGLCVVARSGGYALLDTGDAGYGTERRLLERMRLRGIEVLTAGHHGSKNSVSPELLAELRPYAVLVSAGRNNSYGLPNGETVRRILASGAKLFRTDEQGSVILRCHGG